MPETTTGENEPMAFFTTILIGFVAPTLIAIWVGSHNLAAGVALFFFLACIQWLIARRHRREGVIAQVSPFDRDSGQEEQK